MEFQARNDRYDQMQYRRCGRSGLMLPLLSLGLWHNFGSLNDPAEQEQMLLTAFDHGITYFDLADNYGPPYGDLGSRKHLLAGIDQSLRRMGLEYVDIFYHHRPDPDTPLEETCDALSQIVRQGKALYIGLSNYRPAEAKRACALLRQNRTPCVVMQPNYSMFDRWIEDGLLRTLEEEGAGAVVFKPLEQGLLTGKYLHGIPADSRIRRDPRFLKEGDLNPSLERKIGALAAVAVDRGQSMAQMALAWTLRDPRVTSAIIGASRASQITENIGALQRLTFTEDELRRIDAILKED